MRCGVHQRLPRAPESTERASSAQPLAVQMRSTAPRSARHDIASIPLAEVTQRRPNRTGLPDGLKTGIETLSGLSMDHVRVHHGSAEPARIGALAHARGADIHLGPGQERHLPHEAWHVVQQAQGRVRPTMQLKRGDVLNDDSCAGTRGRCDGRTGAAVGARAGSHERISACDELARTAVSRRCPGLPDRDILHTERAAALAIARARDTAGHQDRPRQTRLSAAADPLRPNELPRGGRPQHGGSGYGQRTQGLFREGCGFRRVQRDA